MNTLRHDCVAVDAALEDFLIALATLRDEINGQTRAEGVSERDWGLGYLRELASGRDGLDGLRGRLESSFERVLSSGIGHQQLDSYRRQIRALLAAFDLVLVAYGGHLAELLEAGCLTCGRASERRYCDACAGELNLEPYDNPRQELSGEQQ